MEAIEHHSARAHMDWAASAAHRLNACAGALALSARHTPRNRTSSQVAAYGTCCHELSEAFLNEGTSYQSMLDLVGEEREIDGHVFEIDEEMINLVADYVRTVRDKATELGLFGGDVVLRVEARVSIRGMLYGTGGTCDALIYSPDLRKLVIIDLKTGMMPVEASAAQLQIYGAGALEEYPDALDVDLIVVQPRADHPAGRTRTHSTTPEELHAFVRGVVVDAQKEAHQAAASLGVDPVTPVWADLYLTRGSHCTYCPAATICPAIRGDALVTIEAPDLLDSVREWSAPELDRLTPEQVARIALAAPSVRAWLSAIEDAAYDRAVAGEKIPGMVLTPKRGRRSWLGSPRETANGLADLGVSEDVIYDRKVRSPAQIEKVLGKAAPDGLSELYESRSSGVKLVPAAPSVKAVASPEMDRAKALFE